MQSRTSQLKWGRFKFTLVTLRKVLIEENQHYQYFLATSCSFAGYTSPAVEKASSAGMEVGILAALITLLKTMKETDKLSSKPLDHAVPNVRCDNQKNHLWTRRGGLPVSRDKDIFWCTKLLSELIPRLLFSDNRMHTILNGMVRSTAYERYLFHVRNSRMGEDNRGRWLNRGH